MFVAKSVQVTALIARFISNLCKERSTFLGLSTFLLSFVVPMEEMPALLPRYGMD